MTTKNENEKVLEQIKLYNDVAKCFEKSFGKKNIFYRHPDDLTFYTIIKDTDDDSETKAMREKVERFLNSLHDNLNLDYNTSKVGGNDWSYMLKWELKK